jgi:hypothetical protein
MTGWTVANNAATAMKTKAFLLMAQSFGEFEKRERAVPHSPQEVGYLP